MEKAPFSGLKLTSIHSRCVLNVALFFENRSYFGEKASGTSAVTAVIYSGTAQSLNGLAHHLIAHETLYQSCHSRFLALVSSLRVVVGLQRLLSFGK